MINQTLDKVSHLLFKQTGNNETICLFYLRFFLFPSQLLNKLLKSLNS